MSLTCVYRGVAVELARVVVDTGAAITILDEAKLASGGIRFGRPRRRHVMVGTGGRELAASHLFDEVRIADEIAITGFVAHVGAAHYGHDLGGLLGLDFLAHAGAVINLHDWTIDFFAGAVQSAQ